MKVTLSNAGVPFVISFRKILRKPKITRERRFVGTARIVKNLLVKVIELIEDVAFETKTTTDDPGKSVVVHWAVTIPDAFDPTSGNEKNLIAFRMLNDMPPCGAHFEIISQPKQKKKAPAEEIDELDELDEIEETPEISPERFAELARAQTKTRQDEILAEGRNGNGGFQRPPAVAYAPRAVKTIEQEVSEGGLSEESENLDRAGREREDN